MSANDGGDPIVLGKEPVERPDIPRGQCVASLEHHLGDGLYLDLRQTITTETGGFAITFHNVEVSRVNGRWVHFFVALDDVVTWEKLDAQ